MSFKRAAQTKTARHMPRLLQPYSVMNHHNRQNRHPYSTFSKTAFSVKPFAFVVNRKQARLGGNPPGEKAMPAAAAWERKAASFHLPASRRVLSYQ
jgi:hypothetical protein